MYVVDTNVISELRKAAVKKADINVVKWASSVSASELFVSSISILELEIGILSKQRKDKPQGDILRAWMDSHVMPAFADRILAFDANVAKKCARLHIPDPKSDRDAMIGATALLHGMTLVTRDIADFKWMKLSCINPWDEQ
ncbi:type II toxin-antitoxin system VapC family toxin [Fangia hongkongensis]|uniref:type II toxin-antitoxin system VapC family toxin n=1 Tax=Fangia hongkongensis TaxID=270495 RepID=UPI00035FA0A4|nr:type II toxin-antitoxin system VapC family toxin [Fangia hongkongensis]MBK2124529.1 type II toxin-antitoxin system VapC family toxin [Fangia hongkongensis]